MNKMIHWFQGFFGRISDHPSWVADLDDHKGKQDHPS